MNNTELMSHPIFTSWNYVLQIELNVLSIFSVLLFAAFFYRFRRIYLIAAVVPMSLFVASLQVFTWALDSIRFTSIGLTLLILCQQAIVAAVVTFFMPVVKYIVKRLVSVLMP
ncbi:hypothetical protein [Reinekea sp. G2M2-21]|uniref:hypothetical protein n=1 Tax=Reinekea sp. G2M2-21 TaxID=2788942 RepID=UPI0018A9C6ED|nr:hypothetical protein [Reinekea sp. G2M2-21]